MTTGKNKITEVLESLDNVKKLSAPDFFYTRLKARMENELVAGPKRPWILRPAYAVLTLVLILLINAAVILRMQSNNDEALQDIENPQSLAAEYSLNENSILYDLSSEQ